MKHLGLATILILLAGCGSGGNVRAVTPVMADTQGTYRLAAATETVAAPGGAVTTFAPYSSGTLRLTETAFTRTVANRTEIRSSGTYQLGTSVNTILNSRDGSFVFTTSDPPATFTGTYRVTPDFTLTLNYRPLPDQTVVTRSETWIKESDSPHP